MGLGVNICVYRSRTVVLAVIRIVVVSVWRKTAMFMPSCVVHRINNNNNISDGVGEEGHPAPANLFNTSLKPCLVPA